MLDTIRVTDALPVVSSVDLENVSYSPALLLPVRFDAAIADDPGFHSCCGFGFRAYFHFTAVDGPTPLAGHIDFLLRNMVFGDESGLMPLPRRTGLALGWLSALALTDRSTALVGLTLLVGLVDCLQFCQSEI